MGKIQDDKYYTPINTANFCWDKVEEVIGGDFTTRQNNGVCEVNIR